MSKTNKKREIVVFDPNSKKLYKLADSILSEASPKDKNQLAYNISYITSKNIMHTNVDVPLDTEEDEISIITNKTYESLNLDIEKDYKISYSVSENSDGTNNCYNVFVVDNENIASNFKDVVKKLQYIDYVDLEPLMYQSYYSNRIIDPSGIHVYIYIHKDYATLAVYKNGEMVDNKIVTKLSIDMLHSAFCNEMSEKIPEHEFLNDLNTYGFDHPDSERRVVLNKVLADAFRFVVNNLTLILRGMQADEDIISKVIVGTDFGVSSNLLKKIEVMFSFFNSFDPDFIQDHLLANKIGFESDGLIIDEFINIHKIRYDLFRNIKDFVVNDKTIDLEQDGEEENIDVLDLNEFNKNESFEISVNPFVLLAFLRANEQLRSPNDVFNVSTFLRPPPFSKRYSGKLALSILGTIVVVSLYPIFNYGMGYYSEFMKDDTNERIQPKKEERQRIEREIEILKQQKTRELEKLTKAKEERDGKYRLLNSIYDKKVNYLSKSAVITSITNILNKNKVKVLNIDIDNNVIQVLLKGSTTGVTGFLKEIGSNPNFIIESRELLIKKEDKDVNFKDGYESEVKIRVLK